MYKIFLSLCLSVMLFCGCSQAGNAETTAAVSETSSADALTEDQKEIQALLTETKQFLYDYVRGYEIQTHADRKKAVTREAVLSNGKASEVTLYKVKDGNVTTKDDLIAKMEPIFTDKFSEEILHQLGDANDYYFFDDNGDIYISDTVGGEGGLLGFDTVHITSVYEADDDLTLNMTAFGSAEKWGWENDVAEDFTITLKRTEEGLKVDKCSPDAQIYITYKYRPEDDNFV